MLCPTPQRRAPGWTVCRVSQSEGHTFMTMGAVRSRGMGPRASAICSTRLCHYMPQKVSYPQRLCKEASFIESPRESLIVRVQSPTGQ